MRRPLFGAVRFLALPTIALVGIAIVAPGRLELAARIYALLVCGAALVLALMALRRAYPTETRLRMPDAARSTRRQPPPSLGRIELEAALGVAGAFDLHYRLVPRLRSIASGLLAARRQTSLDSADGQEALGEAAWALVRLGRPAPEDRLGPGITAKELESVVDALESV